MLILYYGPTGVMPETPVDETYPEHGLDEGDQLALADALIARGLAGDVAVRTQSELIVLRVQRRIRHRQITPANVRVVWVNRHAKHGPAREGVFEHTTIRIDDDGDFIDEWPNGFFEASFHELFDRSVLPPLT